jgi:trimeric autotransporter adhesin
MPFRQKANQLTVKPQHKRPWLLFTIISLALLLVGLALGSWVPFQLARASVGPSRTINAPTLTHQLKPDGTLKNGVQGSFDVTGYQMKLGAGGVPHFVAAQTTPDDRWDGQFDVPGLNGRVNAVAVSGSGDLYVGGQFTLAGGLSANNVARWNGSTWSALGEGVNGFVSALVISGNDVYVGGYFSSAGGISTANIARWNGLAWTPLGSGTTGRVYALAVSGNDLYAGGDFIAAGGVSANDIARWNGNGWSALGNGLTGANDTYVAEILLDGNNVYAGGYFDTAGNVSAHSIARWDGNTWSALGSGVEGVVFALAVNGKDLYVGGYFEKAGGLTVNHVARWNGLYWSALGTGVANDDPKLIGVWAIALAGSDVWIGGRFNQAGEVQAKHVARWNGSEWSTPGEGMNSFVTSLRASGGAVYAGGLFNVAGSVSANRIARWDGSAWTALGSGNGVSNTVTALAVSGNDLYVGGYFTTAGALPVSHIARWDGRSWSALGDGVNGVVHALAVNGNDLYVGGEFFTAGEVIVNHVAHWNGSTWSALGNGVNDKVFALAVNGNDVYAGGLFTRAGPANANCIARWNGRTWSALGSGMTGGEFSRPYVYALALRSGDLYAGGAFSTAGGVSAQNIARWNGSQWAALSGEVQGYSVTALVVNNNDLYVGGQFGIAGLANSDGFARWNGTEWLALSAPNAFGGVYDMVFQGEVIFAGGPGHTGTTGSRLARWDGNTWVALDNGLDNAVYALAKLGDYLYVGGGFTMIGGKPAAGISRFALTPVNMPPAISTAAPLTRQQGSTATLAILATVADAETPAGNLTVWAASVPSGLTVTQIANQNGTITANVAAGCGAALGSNTVRLTVSDGVDITSASFMVNVTPNTPPGLGMYPATSGLIYDVLTIAPNFAPGDNGSIVNLTAAVPHLPFGQLNANPVTGVVTHEARGPAGSFVATVSAQDNCFATTQTTFPLTINRFRTLLTISDVYAPNGTNTAGQEFRIRANVSTSEGTPRTPANGSFTFFDGDEEILGNVLAVSPGVVEWRTTALKAGRHTLTARYAGDFDRQPAVSAPFAFSVNYPLTTVSAASYRATPLAPQQIVTAFGVNLAPITQAATGAPLPVALGGVSVLVKDSAGIERPAPLFFVSPTQVNCLIPASTASGTATITLSHGAERALGVVTIAAVAPGVFTANASGRGLPAAQVLRGLADGTQRYEAVARFDNASQQFVAVPIDLTNATESVFLILYGTGFRARSMLTAVTATIGNTSAAVSFAAAQGSLAGLDQANIVIPPTLAPRGDVDVVLTIDGQVANTVRVNIK